MIRALLFVVLFFCSCGVEKENFEIRKTLDNYEEAFNRQGAHQFKLNLTVDKLTFSSPTSAELKATATFTHLQKEALQVVFEATLIKEEGAWKFVNMKILSQEGAASGGTENLRELIGF